MKLKQTIQSNYIKIQAILTVPAILGMSIYMSAVYLQASKPYGIGINSDSIAYIRAAENLLQGNGLGRVSGLGSFKPMTHWPPLYSLLLAGGHNLGADLYDSARLIGLGLNILLVIVFGIPLFKLSKSVILTVVD